MKITGTLNSTFHETWLKKSKYHIKKVKQKDAQLQKNMIIIHLVNKHYEIGQSCVPSNWG